MSEIKLGRRNLLGGGMKSLAVGASSAVLTGSVLSTTASASTKCGEYTREQYQEYLDAFNRDGSGKGNNEIAHYYTEDVVYERGQNHTMRGIKAIIGFYEEMFSHVVQELELINFAATEDFIAAEVKSQFHVLKDWKHDSGIFLKKGREFASKDFMHYSISDGLISHVRLVNFRRFNDNELR